VLAALAFSVATVASPASAVVIFGDTTGGATYNRALSGIPPTGYSAVGTDVHYQVTSFTVTTSGNYDFLVTGLNPATWDTFLGLHATSFDPSDALFNAVAYNDDYPTIGLSGFTVALTAGTSYFAVVSGFENDDFGTYSLSITGPGGVVTGGGGVPEPASWALMIAGFGLVGGAMRTRSRKVSFA
jgi:hypothetical protein